jgi:amidase
VLLWELSAVEQQRLLAEGEVSSVEVVSAHIERIDAVNPSVNAIVTLIPERALADAARADEARARGEPLGPVHGLPIAIKDLVDTEGIRTTYGSAIYRDHVPAEDAPLVRRLKAAGAIVVGKTNTPEFGAGSQTFNSVFGATRNPYDLARTPGGSSGGAAAAVATRMLPFADGSDLGGSLRNPASFCNVVGLRPTLGRIPDPMEDDPDDLAVLGPLARTVRDTALLLGALIGPDADWSAPDFDSDLGDVRIGWNRNLVGLPVDSRVTAALDEARPLLEGICRVEEAEPDLSDADEAFHVLRAVRFARRFADVVRAHPGLAKDTVVWNVEEGLALDAERIARARTTHTEIVHRMAAFLGDYDALALPASLVPPFPVEVEWPQEIDGTAMTTYLDWMRACTRITVTGHPAISIPFAFTPEGLPVGLQLVRRYGDEAGLLRLAAAIEAATGASARRPEL